MFKNEGGAIPRIATHWCLASTGQVLAHQVKPLGLFAVFKCRKRSLFQKDRKSRGHCAGSRYELVRRPAEESPWFSIEYSAKKIDSKRRLDLVPFCSYTP